MMACGPSQAGRRCRHPPWVPPRVSGAACEGQTHHCLTKCASSARVDRLGALSHGARTVRARCAHGSMFLGWLPNLYPVEWPP